MKSSTAPILTTPATNDANTLEREVLQRYGSAAERAEAALCVPVDSYDPDLLKQLPQEIVEIDYGCGDPSRYVEQNEIVIDLGSGSGKICYILAQKVGSSGKVIGLDFNDKMLSLARKYQDEMANKFGYRNVHFHKAKIQDMALDLDRAQRWLDQHPVRSVEALSEFETYCQALRQNEPLIPDRSVDVVVSNCVLNLVRPEDKRRLFAEIHRVLKVGGRAVISDIVCDEDPTPVILNDPKLWSGCIAGAFREDQFLTMFEEAGFHGIEILARSRQPWQVIEGMEFRSMTLRAFKGKEGPCIEHNQAVVYRGPWKQVRDDDDHTFLRGQRIAVCDKTYRIMTDPKGPYANQFVPIPPLKAIPINNAAPFDCKGTTFRHPHQTKGEDYKLTRAKVNTSCCDADTPCC
jgi:ubiquinone/menaquinone biosynthesis C-methylase UbiE